MAQVIVFDLDDTLIAERDFVCSGFAAVDRYLKERSGIDGFAALAQAAFDAGLRGRIFDHVLGQLGQEPDSLLISKLVTVYRQHEPEIRLLRDAETALGEARRLGLKAALISDGHLEAQLKKIRALKLETAFEPMVLTDLWGRGSWKPHARAFETVMAHYRGEASNFVYIADNPLKDFWAPRKLGWRTVRVARPGSEHHGAIAPSPAHEAEIRVATLDEIDFAQL